MLYINFCAINHSTLFNLQRYLLFYCNAPLPTSKVNASVVLEVDAF